MNRERKGQSPFYPGQPVPVELFVGRRAEIDRIKRAADQVAAGKPQAIFIMGEYGIGKSSLARFVRVLAENDPGLLGFHVMLGGVASLEDMAVRTVQAVAQAPNAQSTTTETIRNFLADYIGEQSLFGLITLRLDQLKQDATDISRGYLPFLRRLYERVSKEYRGIMLILDEINGMATKDTFASFLKNLVDENALSATPLSLLLVLCGTQERHKEIIERHKPVERIFEITHIETMPNPEVHKFFGDAFASVGMKVDEQAMEMLSHYSGGLPNLMHLVGDAAFWIASEEVVTENVAIRALLTAAEDVGRKFVEQQVYRAIRSRDYRNILAKLTMHDFDLAFKRKDIEAGLNQTERKKFNNFLQRMKRLNVLSVGEERGEYIFRDRLTRLYMRMEAMPERRESRYR